MRPEGLTEKAVRLEHWTILYGRDVLAAVLRDSRTEHDASLGSLVDDDHIDDLWWFSHLMGLIEHPAVLTPAHRAAAERLQQLLISLKGRRADDRAGQAIIEAAALEAIGACDWSAQGLTEEEWMLVYWWGR